MENENQINNFIEIKQFHQMYNILSKLKRIKMMLAKDLFKIYIPFKEMK